MSWVVWQIFVRPRFLELLGELLVSKTFPLSFSLYHYAHWYKICYKYDILTYRGFLEGREGLYKSIGNFENEDDMVIAVSPIYYTRFFNPLIDLEKVIAIELQDSEENIFERLVFSDENDNIYKDDEYKEQRKEYFIKDIHEDIVYAKKIFKKIKNKYFINNQSVDKVVDNLIVMIENTKELIHSK